MAIDGNAAVERQWKQWVLRQVPGLPRFWVSSNGRVFSPRRYYGPEFVERRLTRDRDGYLRLTNNHAATPSGKATVFVHRLVMLAWVGPPPFDGAEVRHKNGDPTDNRAANLAWGSHRDNMDDRGRHGRNPRGERNGRAKVTADVVRDIRAMHEGGARLLAGLRARDAARRAARNEAADAA